MSDWDIIERLGKRMNDSRQESCEICTRPLAMKDYVFGYRLCTKCRKEIQPLKMLTRGNA